MSSEFPLKSTEEKQLSEKVARQEERFLLEINANLEFLKVLSYFFLILYYWSTITLGYFVDQNFLNLWP